MLLGPIFFGLRTASKSHDSCLNIPKTGIIIPNMGTSRTRVISVADGLFSKVQQRVLGLLFGQPDRSFHGAEIIRLVACGSGAVHREIGTLVAAGLATVRHIGNQKHYQANRMSPVFSEIHGLIVKTVGLAEPLRSALVPLKKRIHAAFVYGSIAKGSETASSDIDLMVLADKLEYGELYKQLSTSESILGRPVNPSLMTPTEWRRKTAEGIAFTSRVLKQPKIFVIGSKDDLD